MNNDDRRSHGASSLRAFFNDQLNFLHELVNNAIFDNHDNKQRAEENRQIVESFVEASNHKIRAVHGYADQLRNHVCALYAHVLKLAEQIPPPIDLNHDAFRKDSLVNALFVNADQIDQLFKCNLEVNAYLRTHDNGQTPVVYALLTANMSEKTMLGVGMLGDLLVRDVRQQVVNFASHKIHIPCASDTELNKALKKYLFDGVVTLIRQEMTSRIAIESSASGNNFYESRIKGLANPDVYLNALIGYIESPAKLLNIEKKHFKLSKLGIKLEEDDGQCANEFDIHELIWSDSTRNVVLQIIHTRRAAETLPTA